MDFITPIRRIITPEDLEKWKESETYGEIVDFVQELASSVKGKTNEAECETDDITTSLLSVLEKVLNIIKNHPVKEESLTRFGKTEFRDVYDEITDKSKAILHDAFPTLQASGSDPVIELAVYFNESWGNRTRIDYGSGHELNFLAFLLALKKLGLIKPQIFTAITLKVFNKYIEVMRILQKEYWLEPAGSHGVWGLDDYHFLPFLLGASQLETHPHLRPKSIHNPDVIEMFHSKYMYLECIYFINSIKTASLRWHSPMLDDISGVRSWSKVSEGMQKMYKAEVLGKLPIVQHFFFGNILKAPENCSTPRASNNHDFDHDHNHPHLDNDSDEGLPAHEHTWGDCCGIKIPSAIAAHQLDRSAKPLPFD